MMRYDTLAGEDFWTTVIHVASPLEGYLLMKLSAAKCYVWYNRLR